ncbi:LysR family transcriptional regulator [Allopusillimonas ginsengisoli]|uniref:LysR family transcriptional regulator n=1 Tax=Allopusillimonas ginsengisoli TaxID=453575 RepID=UPI0010219C5B|nr:LysR substrate-binding domain-containing protein [Allopusillimonas ginsengisoli]TEA79166.1 LysR family transcriptional regulator [Allopusillimonas ginsengisoli]
MHGIALKYFVEVAQAGSLSAASRQLHVAVSAISRQIAGLEEEIGTPLFERAPRGMVLSEAGQLLLAHARRTIMESASVLHQISNLQQTPQDEIRLAASEGAARGFLAEAMAVFRNNHPHTRFRLHVATPLEAMRLTAEGEVDLAVSFTVDPGEGVSILHSWRTPVYAIMAAGHPLAGRAAVKLPELLRYPLALTDGNSTARHLLDRECALEGLTLEAALSSNYSPVLHVFVRHSNAVMFAGYVSVASRLESDGLVAVPVDSAELQSRNLQIQTMTNRLLPPVVTRFIAHVKEVVDNIEAKRRAGAG